MRQVCLTLCFLVPAFGSARMVAWWLLIVAPIAAALLAANLPRRWLESSEEAEKPTVGAAAVCGLLALGMALSLPWLERYNPVQQHVRGTHRVEHDLQAVAERMRDVASSGRVFTRFEWGEYVGWSLGPDFKVFMDGRIEIFPDEVWAKYAAVTAGHDDWERILREYKVDWLLIDAGPYHGQLRPLVEASSDWRLVVRVGDVLLYRHTPKGLSE